MIQPSDSLSVYLKTLGYSGAVNDMLYEYLIDVNGLAFGSISLNDLIYRTLVAWGYSGTLQDMVAAFLRATGGAGLANYPRTLFANNEQGAWYDPSDFSTLFQDSAGTTPVTALGQPCGLMLDKRLGLVRGAELFSDTAVTFTAPSARVSPGVYRIYSSDGSFSNVALPNMSIGKLYDVSFTIDSVATIGGGIVVDWAGSPFFTTVGVKRLRIYATSTVLSIKLAATACDYQISNLSVRELPGNHAYQSTAASRPTVEARVNLLTYTEQFDNAVWAKTRASILANNILSPRGDASADKLVEDTTASSTHHAGASVQCTLGFNYTFSVYVKAAERGWCWLSCGSTAFGTTLGAYFNISTGQVGGVSAGVTARIESVGDGWYRCSIDRAATVTGTGSFFVMLAAGDGVTSYSGNGASGIHVWGADLRLASESQYPYQRVNTATDYADVGAPRYLQFDGTDDGMVTNSIDFTGTDKMTVWAGVRKLSDAAIGTVAEFSNNVSNFDGVFLVRAPNTVGTTSLTFYSKGTALISANSQVFPSPITAVLTGIGDISGDSATLRVNGVQAASSSFDQGTGNYGNYPLYIGRRAGTSLPFNGRLYGLIIRGAASNASQIAAGEAYMNSKTRAY